MRTDKTPVSRKPSQAMNTAASITSNTSADVAGATMAAASVDSPSIAARTMLPRQRGGAAESIGHVCLSRSDAPAASAVPA